MFLGGLIIFLLGHVLYIGAFLHVLATTSFPEANATMGLQIAALFVFSFSVYNFYLFPHIQQMKIPVLAYVLVITTMLFCAILLYHVPQIDPKPKQLVLFGALLFFISDLGVARQQFVTKSIWNPLTCLPAYYVAQFFLAYSQRYLH